MPEPDLQPMSSSTTWDEPPFTDADLDHHARWLSEHGQTARRDGECPICTALIEREEAKSRAS